MPEVTVGIPVYNGEAYLQRCLASVQRQTEEDFVALIYDNASTDGTREIAESFCSADKRFIYFRQCENRGAANNFIDALNAAETEFFFWLAHDDFISPNFIGELLGLFRSNRNLCLAVPRVLSLHEDGRAYGEARWSSPIPDDRLERIALLLREAPPSWFYALWRREELKTAFDRVWAQYPHGWGSDHLTIYTQIIRGTLMGTNAATMTQTIQHRPTRVRPPFRHMLELRRRFRQFCLDEAEQQEFTPEEMNRLKAMIENYASNRCYSYRKIARRALREIILSPFMRSPS